MEDLDQLLMVKILISISRPGKKIICKHHDFFIEHVNKITTHKDALDKCVKVYGVENEGYIWCKNCGEEICGADYEVLEDFLDSGARNVTHEIIDEEITYTSEQNSEIEESIRKFILAGNNKSITKKSLSFTRIINVITSAMGIVISNKDEIDIINMSENFTNSKIKTLEQYKRDALKQKKRINMNTFSLVYNKYRT